MTATCRECGSTNLVVCLTFREKTPVTQRTRCRCGKHEDALVEEVLVKRLWMYTRPIAVPNEPAEWVHTDLLEDDGEVLKETVTCEACAHAGAEPWREYTGGMEVEEESALVELVCGDCDAPYGGPWSHRRDGLLVTVELK